MFIGDGVLVSALNKEQQGQQRAPSLTAQEDLLPIQQDSTHTPVHRMIQLPGQVGGVGVMTTGGCGGCDPGQVGGVGVIHNRWVWWV